MTDQKKKSIKRDQPKTGIKTPRLYFNTDTQAAIVEYQKATEKKVKDALYVTRILPAFEKLVENLINIYKFTSLHDSYDDLKNDGVNALFETIGKFDESRGTNAFSYFNVVAKNWLSIKSKQRSQRIKRNVSLDDPDSLSMHEQKFIENHNIVPSQDDMLSHENMSEDMMHILAEIKTRVRTDNEIACIDSIITIFQNIDEIDLLNKGATLFYMRELSRLSPKQLTTTMQAIKKHYKKIKLQG